MLEIHDVVLAFIVLFAERWLPRNGRRNRAATPESGYCGVSTLHGSTG